MSIGGKRPRVLGSAARLKLSREERVLLARIDGKLSVTDLANMTGLASEHLEPMLEKLALDGALDLGEPEPPPPPPPPPVSARPKIRIARRPDVESEPEPVYLPSLTDSDPIIADADEPLEPPEPAPTSVDLPPIVDTERELPELEPVSEETPVQDEPAAEPSAEAPAEEEAKPEDPKDEVSRAEAERNYRQVYEKRWHPLPVDQRAGAAKTAKGTDLLALCFDPDPSVIAAILENATCGLDHVRLIAFHHRTGTGLEIMARRQDWIRDLLVERRLLRNPMIGDIVLQRVMQPKRLFPTYKIAIDRDIPDLTRSKCRGQIRQKWQTATSEERADLLTRTEARCLTLMTGCTFDAKTTAILCGRPINSAMFVQSVSKFPAAPPGLLAHLIKQPFVRKNPALKKMLLQHPNLPGDIKRSI